MPIYDFACQGCGHRDEVVRRMADSSDPHRCTQCGCESRRVIDAPRVVGTQKGDTFWSDSLAINPDQAAEHRRHFPNVQVDAEGRLGFDSVRDRSDYCEATGFVKKSQRKEII